MDYQKRLNSGAHRIKPYLPGKPVEELRRQGFKNELVKMASNENPLGVSPAARRAIQKGAGSVYHYPEVSCPFLTEALASRLGLNKQNIIVGNGADGIIYYLGMSLIDKGDEVIIPAATFPIYETISHTMRANVIFTRMKGYSIDLDDILRHITRKTKIIWLCNPNNPTGTMVGEAAFSRFIERIPDSLLLVHDEVYGDFADLSNFPDTVRLLKEGRSNIFLIRSFSKLYGLAGIRVGYGIGASELVRLMYRIRPPFDVSVVAQEAALAAMEDEKFIKKTLDINKAGKEYICRNLDRLGLSYAPSETNFVLLNMGMDDTEVCRRLIERGIIARSGKDYGFTSHIRITVGLKEHNERFIRALEEILTGQ
jgi:histidinol-phosphate aminotransferase